MVGKARRSTGFLIWLSLVCCIAGSFIGDLIKPYLPGILDKSFNIGISPFPLNLKFVSITFGFSLNMNAMSILGLVIAIVLYSRFL